MGRSSPCLGSVKTGEELIKRNSGFNGLLSAGAASAAAVDLSAVQRCFRWCRNRLELVPNLAVSENRRKKPFSINK
jgi:hypothetical protein